MGDVLKFHSHTRAPDRNALRHLTAAIKHSDGPEISDTGLSVAMNAACQEITAKGWPHAGHDIKNLIHTFVGPAERSRDIPQMHRAAFLRQLASILDKKEATWNAGGGAGDL